jgi:imidazole glycerol-phosphate synthase subunit HisH
MTERLALIDYGSGNLRSAAKALERAAADAGLSTRIDVTSDANAVASADRIVLPGVGAFGQCAAALRALPGMWDALNQRVVRQGAPFLGICVGMQLMAQRGLEHGVHEGLGWLDGDVAALSPSDPALKVPHMGWNTVAVTQSHPLLEGLPEPRWAYFVHSYALRGLTRQCLGTTDYGGAVTAIAGQANRVGVQFHPEKSQAFGLAFLQAFLKWRP